MFGFKPPIRILFVCTENTCRSPMAEGLARELLQAPGLTRKVRVSSAGTGVNRPGRRPDMRAQRLLAQAGSDISGIRARQISGADIARSDYVLAMDYSHLEALMELCPVGHEHKISLILSYGPEARGDTVPDPYYGSVEAFEQVFDLLREAVIAFAVALRQVYGD